VALSFLIGWRTRLMSVLSFVLLASLVRRNPYVCHTGDVLLKALSFWAMFLPLGARLSLDRWRRPGGALEGPRVLSLATAGVTLQIFVFYFMAGYLKTRYAVWREGEAVWVFTNVIEYTRPFGAWLGQHPSLCRAITYATLVLEGVAPFFFLCPFGARWLRPLLVLAFASFHLTLQFTIHIGIFQMLCIVMLSLLLPSACWDAVERRLGRPETASSRAESGPSAHGRVTRVASRATDAFLAAVLAVVLVSNLNSAVEDPYDPEERGWVPLPGPVDDYGRMLSLVQSWNMFTDIENTFFGWFLVVGQVHDGSIVDVLQRTPFSAPQLPEHYARFFPNHNSRRYWRQLTVKDAGQPRVWLHKPMCTWLAREWERGGGAPLAHMAIFHVGRVPVQRRGRDQVKPIATEWEAPHEALKEAAPAVQAHWNGLREGWRKFLAEMPKTVPRE
jgi:hypothetical protein